MARTKGRSKGCIKCIARKIKCDESRPFCQRCLKAGYTCLGYRSEHNKFINHFGADPENARPSRDKHNTQILFLNSQPILWNLSPTERQLFAHISTVCLPFLSCVSEKFVRWKKGVELHPGLMQEAYYHCEHALKGLQKAIASFSKENSDAVLASSIIMAWQAPDSKIPHGCAQQGAISTYSQEWLKKRPTNALSLEKLNIFVAENRDLSTSVTELTALIQSIQSLTPRRKLLRPLKSMLFHFPARFIPMINTHPVVMLLMAYLHAITLFVEPAPDIDLVYFQHINVAPIETFYEEFSTRAEIESGPGQEFYNAVLSLMEFPLEAVEYLALPRAIPAKGQDGIKSKYIITVIENFTIGHWDHMLGPE
ncbi:hypothetical protein OIDMADRAFT_33877 [Oidiodendron maius Zn]|uniref:Zn(2)-C6 fungal-type domain-containing protein n=1 Tax=Oidiodendron maius (strain Zn) TaxID=913774 RepID=A0A0C3GZW2_OIDMZ|nr:hypothetical protein OIDMADRAFT_33877 [Oidiodendron maius Zn]